MARSVVSESKELLGDLKRHGIGFPGLFIYDWSSTLPDEDSAAGYGRYSFDLSMSVDGRKLLGLKDSTGCVRLKHHLRNFGDSDDEVFQLYSNIDADSRTILYEAWWEQRLLSDRLRIKAGKIDANSEFAVVANSGDFLNSSMGYSPTIVAFPTYPEPKLGIGAFLSPVKNSNLNLGVFQTAGRGTLSLIEPGQKWRAGGRELPGRISLGYWRLDAEAIDQFDGTEASTTQGFYSVMEQFAWRRSGDPNDGHLAMFLQMGWAEGRMSPVTRHIGAGAVLQGPFRRRAGDGVGVAVTEVRFSSYPQAGYEWRGELVFESYYKIELSHHAAIVQDFQYLHHPGGVRANQDCAVITPRLVITF